MKGDFRQAKRNNSSLAAVPFSISGVVRLNIEQLCGVLIWSSEYDPVARAANIGDPEPIRVLQKPDFQRGRERVLAHLL